MNALTAREVAATQMALSATIEDLEAGLKNPQLPFTPEARKDMNDMLDNAKSALAKIALATGYTVKLDPYREGDEKEFFTKEP